MSRPYTLKGKIGLLCKMMNICNIKVWFFQDNLIRRSQSYNNYGILPEIAGTVQSFSWREFKLNRSRQPLF
jgi:hypothetical protein